MNPCAQHERAAVSMWHTPGPPSLAHPNTMTHANFEANLEDSGDSGSVFNTASGEPADCGDFLRVKAVLSLRLGPANFADFGFTR